MSEINFHHIDNMEFMKQKPDKYYDLAIVDPPYFDGPNKLGFYGASVSSVGVRRDGYKKIGSWGIPGKPYFDELKRVSKDQIVWGCNYYAEFLPVGRIVWDKVNGNSSFSDCELASCSIHNSVRMFKYMWNGMMQGKSIKEGDIQQGNKKLNEKRIHPTQKPVVLYRWLLQQYAKNGFKILDTHGGSFTHAIAADMEGFDLDICEIDDEMFEKGVGQFIEYKRQLTLF